MANVPPITRPLPHVPGENIKAQQIPQQSSQINKKSKKKKKITKEDIGVPRNFRHEVHVGADGIRSVCDTDEIRQFLHQAGLSENDLANPKTKKDVERFIRKNEPQIRQSIMIPRNLSRDLPPPPPKTQPPDLPRRNTDSLNRETRTRPVPPVPASNPQNVKRKTNKPDIPMSKAPPAPKGPMSASGPPVRNLIFFIH